MRNGESAGLVLKKSPRNAKNKRHRTDCPVVTGAEYNVEITEIMSNGKGLAAVKDFWVFVPNFKVGDKVKVRVKTVNSVSADSEVIN